MVLLHTGEREMLVPGTQASELMIKWGFKLEFPKFLVQYANHYTTSALLLLHFSIALSTLSFMVCHRQLFCCCCFNSNCSCWDFFYPTGQRGFASFFGSTYIIIFRK